MNANSRKPPQVLTFPDSKSPVGGGLCKAARKWIFCLYLEFLSINRHPVSMKAGVLTYRHPAQLHGRQISNVQVTLILSLMM